MDFKGDTMQLKRNPLPSAAANSSSAAGGEYEVFLSFRGVDASNTFTDFLYNSLVDAGIRTFRDDTELPAGKEIGSELLEAIVESKISIPIFSKDYASSKRCLSELSQMVECHRTMGQKIFPIFYDVDSSDVRNQTGSYKNAFLQHEKYVDEEIVQRWREALIKVGSLNGLQLKRATNRFQRELVKIVVSHVLLELKKNYMVVNDNLVAMDHHVEKMRELLNVDSDDVSIVGIYGMGGIGKTTIAKVIYNQLLEHFECCCFLIDVRETSLQINGLLDLQKQLISEILKRKCSDIIDLDKGINTIKITVCKRRVLVVLDDVDQKSQFDMLVGKRDWFCSGSRIIITTRNKGVLDQLEVDKTYEPHMMESDHSLLLFSRHAFRMDFPPKDYDILSNKIVSTAAGLPLALEVFGSLLLDKGKDEWEELLEKLKKIPNNKVLNKLMISYEALKHEERQIFLDIACLFIGRDKKYPWYMWDACKFYPGAGINVLLLRSLVKIQDDGKFWMHDQLRDLGREIVRRENFNDPRERSRLWLPEEALDILERRMGTKKVEVLCLDLEEASNNRNFTSEEFQQLPNLRFLQVDYADLTGDFKNLLSNLRWLHWHRCPGNFKLTNFHLKNLVILDLSYSNITDDWEAWSQLKVAKKLKVLDLSHCKCLIRTPDFSTFATLERLILEGCENLVQIHPSIGDLINLRVLNMKNCSVKSLPYVIKRLLPRLEEFKQDCFSQQLEIPKYNWGLFSKLTTTSAPARTTTSAPAHSRTSAPAHTRTTTSALAHVLTTSSTLGGEYQVFLSFGGNTRCGFTDYLYNDLIYVGIRTFRNNDELRVGEEIEPELHKVIWESKISIPIFSRDYASSKWCLLELAQMVKCLRTTGQKILPIFYDVDPSDVQHQMGTYKEAFCQHEEHFDEETVQGWKEALKEVGQLKGWELKRHTDGNQGELVKMVVSKVLLELKKNYMVVTENLVGIDHHVEEMMKLLNVYSNGVLIVGIHGMHGIGKTTIAKVIYNRLSETFDFCSFLANVREISQHEDPVNLQNNFISKILNQKCLDVADVNEGINTIKKTFYGKKVLIVFDDVDNESLFDTFPVKRDWFGSGSRIIITTRNKELLNVLEVDGTYEPPLMELGHSLELFSKHAFRRDSPPEDYAIHSEKVVSTIARLPLALEIIGSFLFEKERELWEETLMRLKKISDRQVQEQLEYLENL